MRTVAELQQHVQRLHAQLMTTVTATEAAALHFRPTEEAWSMAQILAHIAEFEHFFSNDILRLKAHPGSRFGRTMEHLERLQAVSVTGSETQAELLARVDASERETLANLSQLRDTDLTTTGVHPKFGDQSIEWVIGHFITEHLENHIGQIRRTYAAYQQQQHA